MTDLNWTEIIVAAFLLAGTLYGHWKSAQTSRDKTIEAVKGEISTIKNDLKGEIQTIRDDLAEERMSSKAADEELHAELLLFKQESMAAFEKQSAASAAAADKALSVYTAKTDEKIDQLKEEVRRHNEFAKRIPILEAKMNVVEKKAGI